MHVDIGLMLILFWEASPLLSHSEKYFLWLKMAHPEAEMSLENSFTNQIVSNLSLLPSLWTGWELFWIVKVVWLSKKTK